MPPTEHTARRRCKPREVEAAAESPSAPEPKPAFPQELYRAVYDFLRHSARLKKTARAFREEAKGVRCPFRPFCRFDHGAKTSANKTLPRLWKTIDVEPDENSRANGGTGESNGRPPSIQVALNFWMRRDETDRKCDAADRSWYSDKRRRNSDTPDDRGSDRSECRNGRRRRPRFGKFDRATTSSCPSRTHHFLHFLLGKRRKLRKVPDEDGGDADSFWGVATAKPKGGPDSFCGLATAKPKGGPDSFCGWRRRSRKAGQTRFVVGDGEAHRRKVVACFLPARQPSVVRSTAFWTWMVATSVSIEARLAPPVLHWIPRFADGLADRRERPLAAAGGSDKGQNVEDAVT
ncbi:MAG: hypothetical protein BJ554DRAFT_779 [Olpidium bornovanus]|uniref:Uncharacterized protein n=1 Tax=Olpidium bornovanus TaxID=278681 RepID=A0A8H7ZT61_9FUNG|nr:MAG: hypothetical protein BJ554DRAFT_779 [Olpidium bornovanus]